MSFRDENTAAGQRAITQGNTSEEKIVQYFRKMGWAARRNPELEPGWDILLINKAGKKFYVEVKSSAGVFNDGSPAPTGNLQGSHGKLGGGKEIEGWRDRNNKTTHLIMHNMLTDNIYLRNINDVRKWYDHKLFLGDEELWEGASNTTRGFLIRWEEPVWSAGKFITINVGAK